LLSQSSRETLPPEVRTFVATCEAVAGKSVADQLKTSALCVVTTCEFKRPSDIAPTLSPLDLAGLLDAGLAGKPGMFVVGADLCDAFIEFPAAGDAVSVVHHSARPRTELDERICRRVIRTVLAAVSETLKFDDNEGRATRELLPTFFIAGSDLATSFPDQPLLTIELSFDLGRNGRNGKLMIGLPGEWLSDLQGSTPVPGQASSAIELPGWTGTMTAVAGSTTVPLQCVLHRSTVPLAVVASYKSGDILPLHGARLGAIDLEFDSAAQKKMQLVRGTLGSFHGQKAFRFVENAPAAVGPDVGAGAPDLAS